ncbi:MAG TPA: hypothetical protein VL404_08400 [Candidatus Eisenbacteria bacterium]|nr:hypothetical protein [Candidatus Eisenbacteria bacterium]
MPDRSAGKFSVPNAVYLVTAVYALMLTHARAGGAFRTGAVLFFTTGAFLWGTALASRIRRLRFPGLSEGVFELFILTLGCANLGPFLIRGSHGPEAAVAAALFFQAGALYFLVAAFDAPQVSREALTAAGLFLGLMAASRPNLALAAAALAALGLVRLFRTGAARASAALLVPLAAAVLTAFLFHPARFGQAFRFGWIDPPAPAGLPAPGLPPVAPLTLLIFLAPALAVLGRSENAREMFTRRGVFARAFFWLAVYFFGAPFLMRFFIFFSDPGGVAVRLDHFRRAVPLPVAAGTLFYFAVLARLREQGEPGADFPSYEAALFLAAFAANAIVPDAASAGAGLPGVLAQPLLLLAGLLWFAAEAAFRADRLNFWTLRAVAVTLAFGSVFLGLAASLGPAL